MTNNAHRKTHQKRTEEDERDKVGVGNIGAFTNLISNQLYLCFGFLIYILMVSLIFFLIRLQT